MLEGQASEQVLLPLETVTLNVHEAVCGGDAASDAVAVTVVVPTGNDDPEGISVVTVTWPLLSVAVGAKVTLADPEPGELSATVMSAGQVIVGGSVSTTVTLK
jgi:hypothetical protein